jgi:hypothetical protein
MVFLLSRIRRRDPKEKEQHDIPFVRSTDQRRAEADDEKEAHLWLIRVEAEKGRQIKKNRCVNATEQRTARRRLALMVAGLILFFICIAILTVINPFSYLVTSRHQLKRKRRGRPGLSRLYSCLTPGRF